MPKRSTPRQSGRPGRALLVVLVLTGGLYVLHPDTFLGSNAMPWPAGSERATTTTKAPWPATAMNPGMAAAVARAQADAVNADLEMPIASGFRTVEEQLDNLVTATEKYGSRSAAERWVFPPERSMHVRGLAVDIGDGPSADWLRIHGFRYGLCQTLSWEWWHFEWRASWEKAQSCPDPVDEPAEAPPPDDGW